MFSRLEEFNVKKIKYNGKLEHDINRVKNQHINKRTLFIFVATTISEIFIFASVILMMNGFTLSSLIGVGLFGLIDVSVKLVNINQEVCKIRFANERLKFLMNWLEYHNVFVRKKDLLDAIKVEVCIKEDDSFNENRDIDKKVQYYSLLDRNSDKVHILKTVEGEERKVNEFEYVPGKSIYKKEPDQLFLLEYNDICSVDSSLKRVLQKK